MKRIMHLTDVTEEYATAKFTAMVEEYEASYPDFGHYLRKQWLPCLALWCDAIRGPAPRTNNYIEAHFGSLSKRFMKRATGWRLDKLVHMFLYTVFPAAERESAQVTHGELGSALTSRFRRMEKKALEIMPEDIREIPTGYEVRSQSWEDTVYTVTVGNTISCQCRDFVGHALQFVNCSLYCKHVVAVLYQRQEYSRTISRPVQDDSSAPVETVTRSRQVTRRPPTDQERLQLVSDFQKLALEASPEAFWQARNTVQDLTLALQSCFKRKNPIHSRANRSRDTERYGVKTMAVMNELLRAKGKRGPKKQTTKQKLEADLKSAGHSLSYVYQQPTERRIAGKVEKRRVSPDAVEISEQAEVVDATEAVDGRERERETRTTTRGRGRGKRTRKSCVERAEELGPLPKRKMAGKRSSTRSGKKMGGRNKMTS
ncbi:hypothetical protein KIPB_010140 [Kipferlia bialata]|uniref:SWIM-type domain-containing protein n=1 Tax=Kipferlia bialata TaxID=797122 RepID=A0A9K3D5C0_9EUKA|nr:hypothetical protein KIPB_010140 [Kipferlia bialata]|eukprot:g10140.t1